MTFFLRARPIDMFVLLTALYLVGMAIIMRAGSPFIAGLVVAAMLGAISSWLWAIAATANARVPVHLRSSLSKMKTALLAANLGSAAMFLVVMPSMDAASDPGLASDLFLPSVPLLLIAVAGLVYSVLFAAKRLVTFEKQSSVSFVGCIGVAVLFWFWYVGVWFLQPRVQKLANEAAA